jgi:hypothetical protein
MPEGILIGPFLSVDGNDLSAFLEELTIKRTIKSEEFVTSNVGGTTVYQRRLIGTADFQVTAKFSDGYGSGEPHRVLSAAFATYPVIVAALHGATPSASNEVWTDTMMFPDLEAGGPVGTRLSKSITFMHASGVPVGDVTP